MPTGGVSSLLRVGRVAVIALAFLLLAGCGGNQAARQAARAVGSRGAETADAPGRAAASFVHVIVYDGDLGQPVPGAVVQVGSSTGRTGRDGVARIKIGRHARLLVTVARSGYDPYKQRLQFRGKPKVGVRVYQTKLQWRLYGATAARTQTHPFIHVRPPFHGLEPGRRRADGVPGRRGRRRRLHLELPRQRARLLDARWREDLASRHRRQDGRLAGDRRARRSSRTGWTAASCADRHNGQRASGAMTPALRSSRRRSCSTASTTSAPGTGRCTRSTCARAARAGRTAPGTRSPRARPSSNGTLYIGDYGGRLLALARARRLPALVGLRRRPDLRHSRGRERPRVRALLHGRLADRLLDGAAALWSIDTGSTSTRRRRSGTDVSTSAPTTAPSTRSGRAPARFPGRFTRPARSPARPRSSTGSSTSATVRTGSTA